MSIKILSPELITLDEHIVDRVGAIYIPLLIVNNTNHTIPINPIVTISLGREAMSFQSL